MRLISRAVVVFGMLFAPAVALAQNSGTGGSPGKTAAAAPAPTPAPAPAAAPATPSVTAVPVAAPPAAPAAPPLSPTVAPAKSGAVDLSLPPSLPTYGAQTNITPKQAETLTPTTTSGGSDEWKFDFHGYLRAPLRASYGPSQPTNPPSGNSTRPLDSVPPYPPGAAPPPGMELHEVPRVPGLLYTTPEYTNTMTGPWTQLNFSYGNSRVTATVVVDAYNQTDGSYKDIQAQQGIDQAFVTLNFPEAFGDFGGLVWNIGSFPNRYGTAGKYDGGMYETYLFGRTHVSGETLTANFANLDAAGDWSITLEHGLGAKLDAVPFFNNQFYQVFGTPMGSPIGSSSSNYQSDRDVEYLPYSGPVPEGSTFLHHAHIFAKYRKMFTFGLHYLYTWTPDDNWSPINSRLPDQSDQVPRYNGPIQGSMAIVGAEVRFAGKELGDGYLGYSHIDARNINALAQAIEVVHSYSGYNFKQNYFGQTYNKHTGVYNGPENETGTLDNISLQYSFSFGQYAKAPEDFWGDGPDLVLTGFGLMTIIHSEAPPMAVNAMPNLKNDWNMDTKKLKFGVDALYTPLSWIGFGGRFDHVIPDMDDAYAKQGNPGGSDLNFSVLTARAVIKTQFVTHEAVTISYSHYFLGAAAYPSYPYNWVARADADAAEIAATMWW